MTASSLHTRFRELSEPLTPEDTGTPPELKELPDTRAVIYDFYGTLFISGVGDIGVDDGDVNTEVLADTFESSGIAVLDPSAVEQGFQLYNEVVLRKADEIRSTGIEYPEPDIREVWEEVLAQLKAEKRISLPDRKHLAERVAVEFEARMNPVWPVPGIVETLTGFREEGLWQGIISNSQFYTPIALEALTGRSLAELGFSGGLLHWSFEEKQKKPALEFYRTFIEKMKQVDESLVPGNVLYMGNDMLKDIYPAHAVGMKTALFAGDRRSLKWRKDDPRCSTLRPDLVITHPSQLRACIPVE